MDDPDRIFRIFGHLASFLPTLLLTAGGCAIGLSTRGLRGKVWLVIWAGLSLLTSVWWLALNLTFFSRGSISTSSSSWETFQKIKAWESLPQAVHWMAWAALLLFIASQARLNQGYGRVLFFPSGRICRQQWWAASTAMGIVSWGTTASYLFAAAELIASKGNHYDSSREMIEPAQLKAIISAVVMWLWVLVAFWPSLVVQIKRWHDRGKSGWMVLVNLIPIAGPIWSLVELGFHKGTAGPNAYGEDPLPAPASVPPPNRGTDFGPPMA